MLQCKDETQALDGSQHDEGGHWCSPCEDCLSQVGFRVSGLIVIAHKVQIGKGVPLVC